MSKVNIYLWFNFQTDPSSGEDGEAVTVYDAVLQDPLWLSHPRQEEGHVGVLPPRWGQPPKAPSDCP